MKVCHASTPLKEGCSGGVGNGCRVAADGCGRGLLVAYAVPIPNPDLADLAAWVMPLILYVALLWAVWHIPDHFAEEGWGVEALISAPVVFAVEVVSLFFARALFVWFYNVTAFSVLLVAIFHASFDGAINQLSYDIVPASNTARFLIFSAVIVLAATIVIIATKGRLGEPRRLLQLRPASLSLTRSLKPSSSTSTWACWDGVVTAALAATSLLPPMRVLG
jgi:hypothetical protein